MSRPRAEQVLVTSVATSPNCGNLLKPYLPTQSSKDVGGQVNTLGTVTVIGMYNGQSATKPLTQHAMGKVQRLNGGGLGELKI
jgi:hypothetical protein